MVELTLQLYNPNHSQLWTIQLNWMNSKSSLNVCKWVLSFVLVVCFSCQFLSIYSQMMLERLKEYLEGDRRIKQERLIFNIIWRPWSPYFKLLKFVDLLNVYHLDFQRLLVLFWLKILPNRFAGSWFLAATIFQNIRSKDVIIIRQILTFSKILIYREL